MERTNHKGRELKKTLRPNETEEHREVWCKCYEECLDYAIREGWISFSCKWCEEREEGREERK